MCKACVKYALNSHFSAQAWKRGAWQALWMTHLVDDHLIVGESVAAA